MGGGGKGGERQAIYDPQGTSALESALTGMALGRAYQNNPQLGQLFQNNPNAVNQLGELGITPEMLGVQGQAQSQAQFQPQQPQGGIGKARGAAIPGRNGDITMKMGGSGMFEPSQPAQTSGGTAGPGTIANLSPSVQNVDYTDLLSRAQGLPNGEANSNPVQWRPGENFQFQTPGQTTQYTKPQYQDYQYQDRNISPVSDAAYNGARDQVMEDSARTNKQSIAQSQRALSRSGLGRSGFMGGAVADANRAANESTARASRDIGLQKAQSAVDASKFNATTGFAREQAQSAENKTQMQLDQWRQQQQGAENMARSQMGLQTQQAQAGENIGRNQLLLQGQGQLFNQDLQNKQNSFERGMKQIGLLGSLQQSRQQQQMEPYQMLQQLYGQNIGIPMQMSGGKGDPFSAILGAGAQVGSSALLACLPEGTLIECEDGSSIPVEQVKIGDRVKGGFVISKYANKRNLNHHFSNYVFSDGKSVTMTIGHPYDFNEHEIRSIHVLEEHESPTTNDILTSEGFYYVNGVKLLSTLARMQYGRAL